MTVRPSRRDGWLWPAVLAASALLVLLAPPTLAGIGARSGRRTVAVLGEMRELGPDAEAEHRAVGALAARLGVDVVVVVGEGAAGEHDRQPGGARPRTGGPHPAPDGGGDPHASTVAIRWRATLSWRLPVRLRRWRSVLLDQTGSGAEPL